MKLKKLPVFSAGARYSTNCILSFLYLSGTDSLPWSDFIKKKCPDVTDTSTEKILKTVGTSQFEVPCK